MRLIDADALKDKCYITINGVTIGRNNYVMFHEIDDAPTIDAVQVVRCKDCRHGGYEDDIEYYVCRHPTGLNEELYGVDFCSYGKRREK